MQISPERLKILLLSQFPYEPTRDQELLIQKLSLFIPRRDERMVFILKGYAGTGKTTVVSSLVHILPRLGKSSVLLAPTGRAAKVLSSYSGNKAFTIHKKIYRPSVSGEGAVHLSLMPNPHTDTLFIVDEASMIPDASTSGDNSVFWGRSLLEDLLNFVFSAENNMLLLLGDSAQLPPVGTEKSPALDPVYLKNNFHLNTDMVEMKQVVRQAQESGILVNATDIRQKIAEEDSSPPFFAVKNYKDIVKLNGSELEELLNTYFSRGGNEDTVVITRSNKRANLFNQGIRNRILFREEDISAGDYLMVVKNNYYWLPKETKAGFIANGDIVEVMSVMKKKDIYGFQFARVRIRMIDYPEEPDLEVWILLNTLTSEAPALAAADQNRFFNEVMLDYADVPSKRHRVEKVKNNEFFNALQVKFAYALTCHKTQGGQWENVIIDQGWMTDEMLNVEYLRWLYTAITRATRKLFLLNFKDEFYREG